MFFCVIYELLEVLGPSGPRLLAGGPSDLLTSSFDFVRPCDPRQKIGQFWPFFAQIRPNLAVLANFSNVWPILTIFKPILAILANSDPFRQTFGNFGQFWPFFFVKFGHVCQFLGVRIRLAG